MKIHFSASPAGNQQQYQRILSALNQAEYPVITDFFATTPPQAVTTPEAQKKLAKQAEKWIKKADVVIFEATQPDINIGYEISLALNLLKSVIVLYAQDQPPLLQSLIAIKSDKLQVCSYSADTIAEVLEDAIETAKSALDVRFNFFISPSIAGYLDWMARYKKIPRSVYLRSLIESEMLESEEYQAFLTKE